MTTYKLNYTGAEINAALDKILNLVFTIVRGNIVQIYDHEIPIYPISKTEIINQTDTEDVSISPNILNKWGAISSLTISTFDNSSTDYVDEYMLEFIVNSDDFELTLPEGVRWASEPFWTNGSTYQVSIINNLAVYAGWEAPEV